MNPIIKKLKDIDRRKILLLITFTTLFFLFINYNTKDKLTNGYHFFLSFFSIVFNLYSFIFFMLVLIAQEERKPKDPFYLFRYVAYVFLLILFIGPFIYLWSMRDIIAHLSW
jgi:hypothetical protein